MKTTISLPLILLFALFSGASLADASAEFDALLSEHWQWHLSSNPEQASMMGDRRFNDQWQDQSPAAFAARNEAAAAFLRRVYAIDREALPVDARLNHELLRRQLQDQVDAYAFNGHLQPFSHFGGIQDLNNLTSLIPFSSTADYDDWLLRLASVDDLIAQTIALAEAGRKAGIVAPRVLMQRIPDQLDRQLVEFAADSPMFDIFEDLPESFSSADRERLRAAAIDVIDDEILPAYRKLDRYFHTEYLPNARTSIGLSASPDGAEHYEYLARSYTTTRMTPDDIHQLGLEEVRRIRGEMDKIIAEVEFDGSFDDFLEFLRTDPQFYFDNPDDLYNAYLATSKRIDPELVKLFGKLPRMPYGVKPIDASIAPDVTTAYYTDPAADGSRAGIFWVNLYQPETRPKYEIEVLSVHEAMPGHHLQLALQQELGELPEFRRYMWFTAFVEGWGLYSERLGYELGLYKDPYSRFGQLTYDMWRAVRLVVDTGIHYKGWTREQAIDFFKANAAKTEHDIVNEIDRYIAIPGQALAYKIGQLKMLTLRDRAQVQLGERFDIRAFHDELLGAGALPLDLLQQRMDAWLEQQLVR